MMLTLHLFIKGTPKRISVRSILIPAALAIAIVYAKPMAFYLPGLIGVILLLSAAHALNASSAEDRRVIIVYHMTILVCTVLAYAALVLPNFTFFRDYIRQALSARWSINEPVYMKAFYYLPFAKSPPNLPVNGLWGSNFWSFILIAAAFTGAFIKRKNKVALAGAGLILLATIAALAPISLSSQIQQSFGSFFACLVIAIFVYMHNRLQWIEGASKIVNVVLIALSALSFTVATRGLQEWIPNGEGTTAQAQKVVQGIVSELNPNANGNIKTPAIYFTFTSPIPAFDIGIEFYKRYGSLPSSLVEAYVPEDVVASEGIGAYQYVVMYSPDLLPKINDANREQASFQKKIFSSWNLTEVGNFPFAGAEYRLYRVGSRREASVLPAQAL
ncbi:hypothetical protein AWV79_15055 [Cupriavidus sp. UYMMa02A]|nr:hypothetical protein AWV79_15055 [Cupriavidus sp. UYMMa02A]